MGLDLTESEAAFIEQRHEFLELARLRYPDAPQNVEALLSMPCRPATSTVVDCVDPLASGKSEKIAAPLLMGEGVSHVVPLSFTPHQVSGDHVLLGFASAVAEHLPLRYAVDHPKEQHPEAFRSSARRTGRSRSTSGR